MKKPNVVFHNTETNEVIDREMNDEEFAKYQALEEAEVIRETEVAAKAAAKAALLAQLGITEEQAKLLLS